MKNLTLVLLLVLTASNVICQVDQSAPRFGFVFSPDQRYVVIDLSAGRIVGSGSVPEIVPLTGGFADLFGEHVLLQSATFASLSSPDAPTKLAVLNQLRDAAGPRPRFARFLSGAPNAASVVWAKVLGKNLLAVSSSQNEQIQTAFYDSALNVVKTLREFYVTPTTCASLDGQTIYSVASGSGRSISLANLRSLAVTGSSYSNVGNPGAFYKAPMASDGCVVAFIERMSKATAGPMPATIYLRDVEKSTTLNSFPVAGDGRFALVLERSLLLLDLTELSPNTLPDGTIVGVRRASTGTLVLYDTASGKETSRIAVPVNGRLADVSVDGKTAYYLSPSLLTVVDLLNARVAANVKLPFPDGIFVLASDKAVAPAGRPDSPPSSRKSACGCYACGVLLSVDFPNKSPSCAGILATDACPQALAEMPDKGAAFCKEVKKSSKDRSLAGCTALANYCSSLERP